MALETLVTLMPLVAPASLFIAPAAADPVSLEERATVLEAEGRALFESRPIPGTKAELDAHLKLEAAARLRDRAAELRRRSARC